MAEVTEWDRYKSRLLVWLFGAWVKTESNIDFWSEYLDERLEDIAALFIAAAREEERERWRQLYDAALSLVAEIMPPHNEPYRTWTWTVDELRPLMEAAAKIRSGE